MLWTIGILTITADMYWHPHTDNTSYCNHPATPNNPFVMSMPQYTAYTIPEAEMGRFGYFTWNETEFDIEANLAAVPVVRMSPPDSTARGMEIGNAWFFIAPGGPLLLDLRGLHIKTYTYRIEPPDPIHDWIIDQGLDGFIRYRFPYLPIRELVLNTQPSVSASEICPVSIKYGCECVEYRSMAICKNTTVRANHPVCQHFDSNLGLELLAVCIVFGIAFFLRWSGRVPPSWVSAGLCVWLPANIVADGLVFMVPLVGGLMATVVTLCTQLGNVPLLAIKKQTLDSTSLRRYVKLSYIFGGISLLLALVAMNAPAANNIYAIYTLMGLAAFVSGSAGAIGCTGLWGLVPEDAVRSLSIGMSLGSAFTGLIMISVKMTASHPRISYPTGVASYVASAVFGWVSPESAPSSSEEETMILVDAGKEPPIAAARASIQKHTIVHYYRAFFTLYGLNYFLPSLFPFAIRDGYDWYYAIVIITLNAADSCGRAMSTPRILTYERTGYVMWAVGIVIVGILMGLSSVPYSLGIVLFALLICTIAGATFIRGGLVTEMQTIVKGGPNGRKDGWWLAAMGQAGGCAGALVGLMIVVLYI
jgi:hypothetical protein